MKKSYISDFLLCFIVVVLAIVFFKFLKPSPKIFIVFIGLSFFFLSFFKTNLALVVLIFSMLLSPEIVLAEVPSRAVVLRIDDILLIVIFFGWLAKMAVNKELGLLKHTPITGLMLSYIAVCVVSTLIGILSGIVNPLKSFFYILKYTEYFLLYFMVANNIDNKEQIKVFIVCFMITAFIICVYALLTVGKFGRATAPFEGIKGEPNTLGGYLMFMLAIFGGIFLYTSSRRWQIFIGMLLPLMVITLLETLSRGSYLAFVVMYFTLVALTRRRKIIIIGMLILGVVIFPLTFPNIVKGVKTRIFYTFSRGKQYDVGIKPVTLEESAASRVESFKDILRKWAKRPLLGYGVTGVGLVDTQYPRVLGETGIVGFFIFILLLVRILQLSFNNLYVLQDDFSLGLALGFLAGFIGLLIHSFSANTFIIVRIMEPFWFMAAIVSCLPNLSREENVTVVPEDSNVAEV